MPFQQDATTKRHGKIRNQPIMNPVLPDFPPLPDNPIEGTFYRRPCVRAHWPTNRVRWLPILGPVHSDPEHIRAEFQHVHVDYRFLDTEIRYYLTRLTWDFPDDLLHNRIFSTPISLVTPHGCEKAVALDEIHRLEIDPKSWMSVRPRKYQGAYPPYPYDNVGWLHGLSEAYAERTLTNGHICPHRGTDLTGIFPDDDGVVTCPLHGLRWCVHTGRMVTARQGSEPMESRMA